MKKTLAIFTFFIFFAMPLLLYSQDKDSKPFYEMRVYFCHPGKLEDLLTRFRDHTTKLFEKHGMKNIGYWVPIDNKENKLVYILSYPNKASRDSSWRAFSGDLAWKAVQTASEVKGKIVAKVVSTYMKETDFSQNDIQNIGNRVFELRTYTTTPYNLGLLLARFRNYTCGLFSKYGMTNLAYYTKVDDENTLIYLLAHKSKEAGLASFDGFRKDPDWIVARDASEKLAKGSLTASVISEYLVPTDFSTWK